MPKNTVEVVETLVNRSVSNMTGIERRWKHLNAEQKKTTIAALQQAVARLEDSDNRSNKFKLS